MSNLLLAFHSSRRVLARPRTDAFKSSAREVLSGNARLATLPCASTNWHSSPLSRYESSKSSVQTSPASEIVCRRGRARVRCSAATKASREITDKNLLWIHIEPEQCKVPDSLRRPASRTAPTKLHRLKAFVRSHKFQVLSILNQLCYNLKS